ncbi:c-type cytochrome synthesis protein (plastid) [Chondrus crispus]|uniref:Cytochrome c biogenesis protein CcsA n=1 Tax=Chondrus crispus TaxID=2769 RepID=M5DD44_CHOCR|nr:c-type cytochrome synthesis protein [Chondrus crispus]CCP38215.1 c-type cytochrome synthesis protein [Chondrus crispus]|eukprot:YP_007627468.1 c-type cytochrome synthesis protein (plastid) [Chondrus crispus]
MNSNLIENTLINLSFAILLFTLFVYWINIAFTNLKMLSNLGKICTLAVNLCLSSTLIIRWIENKYFPLSNLYESLIFLTWGLTLVHLILEQQNKSKLIGAINTPICLFIIAFTSFSLPSEMKKTVPLVPALRSNWLMMHVSIMMISYALLILGSLLSILFLIIYKVNLKNSNINQKRTNYRIQMSTSIANNSALYSDRMSILQIIDNLSYRIIGLGFPLLTIGIIAGAVWANDAWGSYWSWDPKETWALITWLIFAAYLHSRFSKSWAGEKPAILASIGFLVVWICYLGVNFLGKGLHSYGWLS